MRVISKIGSTGLVYIIPGVILLCFWSRKALASLFFAPAMLGTTGLALFFKAFTYRARPDFGRSSLHHDSFPSGHTLAATILVGILLVIFLPTCRNRSQRVLLWTCAGACAALMGASRVYLGRHFPTEVVGAWLIGASWVLFCKWLMLFAAGRRKRGAEGAAE